MGATEKRRERGAVCRGIGGLSQRGEWGAVYQGWVLGVGEACAAPLTTSHLAVLRVEYAKDPKALFRQIMGSDPDTPRLLDPFTGVRVLRPSLVGANVGCLWGTWRSFRVDDFELASLACQLACLTNVSLLTWR